MSDQQWRADIQSDDIFVVEGAIIRAANFFSEKLFNQTGSQLVATMPIEMLEWFRTTATLIITGEPYWPPNEKEETKE